jgi:TonB family protein
LATVESEHRPTYNLKSIHISGEKESTMNRPFNFELCSRTLCAALLCVFSVPVSGQTPQEIESLATRTADRVTKIQQPHIFVAGLQGCQLDLELCASFEASLRAELEKSIPGVRFIGRESVINILEGRGFLALDAYFPDVLRAVTTQAGADVLVTDTLRWQPDGYEVTSEVYDAVRDKKLDQFRVKIIRTPMDSGGEPLVFTDPLSKVSLIVPRGSQITYPLPGYPKCARCPDPSYTPEARSHRLQGRVLMLVTVTQQGVADNIDVVDGLDDGLTGQAVEAVRSWQFKPGIGNDGKPIATRVPIEATFRLR